MHVSSYFSLGKYPEALSASKKAIELGSRLKENIVTYACSELCVGEIKRAAAALEEHLRKEPDYPLAVSALTIVYLINGNKAMALNYLKKFRQSYAGATQYLYNFSKYFMKSNRFRYATILLEIIMESNAAPQDTQALLDECLGKLISHRVADDPAA